MMEREARPDTGRGENPIFRNSIHNIHKIHKIPFRNCGREGNSKFQNSIHNIHKIHKMNFQGNTPLHFVGLYATKKAPNLTRRSSRLSACPAGRKSIAATFCRLSSAPMGAECNLGRVQRAGRREARQASLELGSVATLPFFVPENPKSNEVRTWK